MLWDFFRERSRSRAVERLGILGNIAEPGFDCFVQQAADAFDAPMSLLTLLHDDMLWVKAATGVQMHCAPRDESFCNHAVDRGELLEVCDASADPVFQAMPSVLGEPYIRYYLGAPLTLLDGTDFGALCVLDTHPRPPASRDQRAYLTGLARQASQAMERDAHIKGSLAA
ncbi:MAG: GAF domain-containing protein [Oxalobacteraceae bacterium]|nr:MAG: GAF domain-containing protein [Oxalobacteraceae bacterium]